MTASERRSQAGDQALNRLHDPAIVLAATELHDAKTAADLALVEANVARAALSEAGSNISRRTAELDEREARLRGEEALTRREQAFRDACTGTIAVAMS